VEPPPLVASHFCVDLLLDVGEIIGNNYTCCNPRVLITCTIITLIHVPLLKFWRLARHFIHPADYA